MSVLLWIVGSRLGRIVSGALGAAVAVLLITHKIGRAAINRDKLKRSKEDAKAREMGRRAVAREREAVRNLSNSDILDRLRARDQHWR